MLSQVLSECGEELAERADPTPAVARSTRLLRQVRAEQLDEIHTVVSSAVYYTRGYRSPSDWLATTTHESHAQCRVTLRLADRIQHMPQIKDAFARGDLAESALRVLTDAWHPDIADQFARDEGMLCGWATRLRHRDLVLLVDTWRMHADPEREERSAQERFEARRLHLSSLLDGMGRLDGLLDPEGFALVSEALRALARPADDAATGTADARTAAQRRADALVEMARLTLGNLQPTPGRKRRRPKVVATIAYQDLVDATGGAVLDAGGQTHVVPAQTARRLACDSDVHRYISGPQGTIIDFGRTQRVVSDPLFDTLLVRDHGCRWIGCSISAHSCDAHHAVHWADGGETKPDQLLLLCWFHHHLLHEQHWSIEPLGGGHFELHDPDGTTQPLRPPMVGLALPVDPPRATLREPAHDTGSDKSR